jgi:hypothetical protein
MFEKFLGNFQLLPPGQKATPAWQESSLLSTIGYPELADRVAGCTFESGLYRLHDSTTGPLALDWIAGEFPEFKARARPFGYDWLGRQFAIDIGRMQAGQPLVLLLEPGTGEGLEIPVTFDVFHDEELAQHADAALASEFFEEWAKAHGSELPLAADQCVGYRVPLFLGGRDSVENLEVIDLDVYWTTCGQLRQGALKLPEGTSIRDVSRRG